MRMSNSDLIGLAVETKSGDHLGKVADFEVNTDTGKIENIHVKTGLIQGLWHEQLVIAHNQIIEITKEKVIVEDMVSKEKAAGLNLAPVVK